MLLPVARPFLLAGAFALSLGAAPALADLEHLLKDLARPHLASAELPEAQRLVRVGHLELDMRSGAAHPVLAGSAVVGAFFHGDGRFRYRSEDRYEASHFALNVKRSTSLAVAEGLLGGEVRSALFLDSRLARQLPGETGFFPEGLAAASAEAFRSHRSRFEEDRGPALAHLLAQSLLEEGEPPLVAVQLESRGADLLYLYDGVRSQEETLSVLERYPPALTLYGKRYADVLSVQPLSGDRLGSPEVPFVLRRVDLELVNPQGQSLAMEVRETYEIRRPTRTLGLRLWSQRIDEDEVLEYRLESATLADGTAVATARTPYDDLVVELPRTQQPGESVELAFRLSGEILYRPGGDSFWWLPIDEWLPRPERLDMAGFTYHAVVKTAKPFLPFSMGTTVRRWEEGNLGCAEFALDRPVQFAVVLAGKYNVHTEERDGRKIHLASYVFDYGERMRQIAHNTFELIRLYEPLLGAFPFEELTILEVNDYGWGMAPPGIIYLTREAFDPGPAGRAYREELNLRMAHEVAHMWWGHVVQMASREEQWLSESTAEYYASVALNRLLGEHKSRRAEDRWKEQENWLAGPDSVYLANQLVGAQAFRDRYALLYARGPLMLARLRQELGDQVFFSLFKSALTNFHFRPLDTGTFLELADFVAQRETRPWFERELFAIGSAAPNGTQTGGPER